jgi:hypothetical protein
MAVVLRFLNTGLGVWISGLAFALIAFILYLQIYDRFVTLQPVSAFFTAAVTVPDFAVGTDPLIYYKRDIRQNFVADFTVTVRNTDGTQTGCRGRGEGFPYKIDQPLKPGDVTLTWYVYDECTLDLLPGQYYLETLYEIRLEELPRKFLTTLSNVFTVYDPAEYEQRITGERSL